MIVKVKELEFLKDLKEILDFVFVDSKNVELKNKYENYIKELNDLINSLEKQRVKDCLKMKKLRLARAEGKRAETKRYYKKGVQNDNT